MTKHRYFDFYMSFALKYTSSQTYTRKVLQPEAQIWFQVPRDLTLCIIHQKLSPISTKIIKLYNRKCYTSGYMNSNNRTSTTMLDLCRFLQEFFNLCVIRMLIVMGNCKIIFSYAWLF